MFEGELHEPCYLVGTPLLKNSIYLDILLT